MTDPSDPLVLDLVEWVAREPRLYADVIDTWRTASDNGEAVAWG